MKTIVTLDLADQPYGFPQLDGSGSLQATGSLYGTASWATNFSGSITNAVIADTASYVVSSNVWGPYGADSIVTSSYALTASYALNGGGGGGGSIDTGSFATTGSNNFVGDQTITGSSIFNHSPTAFTENVLTITNTSTTPSYSTSVLALDNSLSGYPVDIRLGSSTPTGLRMYADSTTLGVSPNGAGFQFYRITDINYPGQVYFDGGAHNNSALIFRTAVTSGTITERMRITSAGLVGIGKPTPAYALDVSGSGNYSNGLTVTGSLNAPSITGSLQGTASWANNAQTASYVLNAISASYATTASFLTGTVTNATNASSGSNFVVTSTLAIDETLTDFAKYASTIVGSNNMFQQATGSWTSAHGRYTAYKGANSRAGHFITSWNGTTVSYTDVATVDIGSTSDITFSSAIVSSQLQINAVAASSAWTVKMLVTYL